MIVLPFPPSMNRYWRTFRGRMLLSAHGRSYRQQAAEIALTTRPERFGDARVAVEIAAFLPDKRRRDLDNLLKASLDALGYMGVYDDDSQIDALWIRNAGLDRDNPRLEVQVRAA